MIIYISYEFHIIQPTFWLLYPRSSRNSEPILPWESKIEVLPKQETNETIFAWILKASICLHRFIIDRFL